MWKGGITISGGASASRRGIAGRMCGTGSAGCCATTATCELSSSRTWQDRGRLLFTIRLQIRLEASSCIYRSAGAVQGHRGCTGAQGLYRSTGAVQGHRGRKRLFKNTGAGQGYRDCIGAQVQRLHRGCAGQVQGLYKAVTGAVQRYRGCTEVQRPHWL